MSKRELCRLHLSVLFYELCKLSNLGYKPDGHYHEFMAVCSLSKLLGFISSYEYESLHGLAYAIAYEF